MTEGFSVTFTTAAELVHQLMEARDEKRLLRLQAQLTAVKRKRRFQATACSGIFLI